MSSFHSRFDSQGFDKKNNKSDEWRDSDGRPRGGDGCGVTQHRPRETVPRDLHGRQVVRGPVQDTHHLHW